MNRANLKCSKKNTSFILVFFLYKEGFNDKLKSITMNKKSSHYDSLFDFELSALANSY